MSANQTECFRGLSSMFWWLKSTNHMKFTEVCVICMEKHVIEKMFTNGLNCSKMVEIVFKMNTSQVGPQWQAHLK